MSIDLWNVGDLFTARIYKRLASRPDLLWANTYELQVNGGGEGLGVEAAEAVITRIAGFESALHLSDVQFDRGVFSTFVPDGAPYDPDTFASYSLAGFVGERTADGDPLALQTCLKVRKGVPFGRAGRFLFRRVLAEADVTSPSGDPVLSSAITTALNAILAADGVGSGGLVDDLSDIGAQLVMAGVAGGVTRVRRVNTLTADGVTIKAYNNRYFDRVVSAP